MECKTEGKREKSACSGSKRAKQPGCVPWLTFHFWRKREDAGTEGVLSIFYYRTLFTVLRLRKRNITAVVNFYLKAERVAKENVIVIFWEKGELVRKFIIFSHSCIYK